jgi:hypothetical protein
MPICTDSYPDTPKPEMAAQSAAERARGTPPPATQKGGDIHPPLFSTRPFVQLNLLRQPQPPQAFSNITLNLISGTIFRCANFYFVSEQPDVLSKQFKRPNCGATVLC